MLVVLTERLYYTDCYLSVFDAFVVDRSSDGLRTYLDRTAFYPNSGGQPQDLGQLGGQQILEVIDEDHRIAHVSAAPLQADHVHGEIDWTRRYDHMQQHTGQHALSAVLVQLFGFQTLSFHMGTDVSTIEIGVKELTGRQIDETEQRANAIVREARPVTIAFEEAAVTQGLRKPSGRSGRLRIIEIQGLDRSACGGTHLRSTAEIGLIQIRRVEKIRGNVRVEFVCGIRALRRAKQDFTIASELSRQAAVAIDQLPEHAASVRRRLSEAEKTCQKLTVDLARAEGEALYEKTPPHVDTLRRVLLRVPAIDEAVRAKAQAFTNRGKAVVLAIAAESSGVLVACSADSGFNAGAILKSALAQAGGRGGGSPTLAQGNSPDASVAESLVAALGLDASA